jgi:hypothetical protein
MRLTIIAATGVRRIVAISAGAVATMATPGRPNQPMYDPGDVHHAAPAHPRGAPRSARLTPTWR